LFVFCRVSRRPDEITEALLRLLCNNEIEFDFIDVLQRLPSHWSLASLAQIIVRALRTYSYMQRSSRIEAVLSRVQNEKLTSKLNRLTCSHTIVNKYRRCKHCLQQFYETSCVVYQDGSQVHVHCAKYYSANY
jgi:Vam6/Vps39-like protein vacuolar protein sorting-associated protein 39